MSWGSAFPTTAYAPNEDSNQPDYSLPCLSDYAMGPLLPTECHVKTDQAAHMFMYVLAKLCLLEKMFKCQYIEPSLHNSICSQIHCH